jgi:hypothetical protein
MEISSYGFLLIINNLYGIRREKRGDGENRTRVQDHPDKTFYKRSLFDDLAKGGK